MAKEKVPDDLMSILSGKKPDKKNTDVTQVEHSINTDKTQTEHIEKDTDITRLREYQDKTTVTFSVRLLNEDREALRDHFKNKGLKITQGVRMLIKEYMEREGI